MVFEPKVSGFWGEFSHITLIGDVNGHMLYLYSPGGFARGLMSTLADRPPNRRRLPSLFFFF